MTDELLLILRLPRITEAALRLADIIRDGCDALSPDDIAWLRESGAEAMAWQAMYGLDRERATQHAVEVTNAFHDAFDDAMKGGRA